MKLYNTLSGNIEEIEPSDHQIRIYLCGITVYDYSHLGHARTVIMFDVLRRYLLYTGHKVRFVQNFTDVDDKIINASKQFCIEPLALAEKFITKYYQEFDLLNVLKADEYPRATSHIQDMLELIRELVDKQFAYVTENGVYFSVSSDKDYGKLSKKPLDELQAGARVEIDPVKKDPLDFALWKFYNDGPLWESPWGKGRPGWHIECSAMSLKYLGNGFEIHGGGEDLVFPHHENEIAQAECYSGKLFAKYWIHIGMVTTKGEKMAKSLKNIEPIHSALKKWGGNAVRLYCLSGHYRKTLDYDEQILEDALARWRDIETCAFELMHAVGAGGNVKAAVKLTNKTLSEFLKAIEDDFDTPHILTLFAGYVRTINRYAADGLLTRDIAAFLQPTFDAVMYVLGLKLGEVTEEEKREIMSMIDKRNELRAKKQFAEADRIREQLSLMRIELMDHKDRTVWKKLS